MSVEDLHMKTKRPSHVGVAGEVIKIVELEPVSVPSHIGDVIRLRIELLQAPGMPRRIWARVWRMECYRVRPSFPQENGRLAEGPCDELMLVEDRYFVPEPKSVCGRDPVRVLRKIMSVINSKLFLAGKEKERGRQRKKD